MKYWKRIGKIMKFLSYTTVVGVFVCIYFGLAYYSIIFLLFSFHLSSESELCQLRSTLAQVIDNQKAMVGVSADEATE